MSNFSGSLQDADLILLAPLSFNLRQCPPYYACLGVRRDAGPYAIPTPTKKHGLSMPFKHFNP